MHVHVQIIQTFFSRNLLPNTHFYIVAILTELNSKSSSLLVNTVMEETGGVGVDIFIDNGGMKISTDYIVILFVIMAPGKNFKNCSFKGSHDQKSPLYIMWAHRKLKHNLQSMWLFSELPIGTCFQILMWFPKIFSLLLSINDPCLFPISRISAVQLFSTDDDKMEAAEDTSYTKPTKHEVLNCLAVHAKWVTTQHDMQVHVSQYGRRGRRERGREGRGLQ